MAFRYSITARKQLARNVRRIYGAGAAAGELRDRSIENQRHRASGLTLVTAAVTLWNTVYLDRAVQHLRGSGVDVPDELLARVAPLGWEHIGLTGDYLWGDIDKPRERFRPLRLHQQSRDA